MNHKLVNGVINPIVKPILRSPFRALLPNYWALLTYTGIKTHKKHSLPVRVAQYGEEFVAVPGCFGEIPAAWWRNFHKESMVDLFYRGKPMACFARAIENDETIAVPRLATYLRNFPSERLGITTETTEEMFNELVTMAAKTYSIVAIRPCSSSSSS